MDRQCSSCGGFCKKSGCERENVRRKEWQGLTDEEIKSEWLDALSIKGETFLPYIHFARVIEQILKEKNNG